MWTQVAQKTMDTWIPNEKHFLGGQYLGTPTINIPDLIPKLAAVMQTLATSAVATCYNYYHHK